MTEASGDFAQLCSPSFGMNINHMDFEADMSADELLYYLSDNQGHDTTGAFDPTDPLLDLPVHFQSSPTTSSPPSSFFSSSSSSSMGNSPISSPSSSSANSTSGPSSPLRGEEMNGNWDETIDNSSFMHILQPSSISASPLIILPPSPTTVASADDENVEDNSSKAPKKDTRKRKRTKKNADEPTPATAVTIPRDELLKLTSQELEDYAENLRKARKLTTEEEKDLRRQRRLIKNRESAQLSRVRRREQMETVGQQLQEIQDENTRLKKQVETLTAENLQLKQQLAATISSSSTSVASSSVSPTAVTSVLRTVPSSPSFSAPCEDDNSSSLAKMVQSWTTLGKGATANAVKATYLFVILLSIGLFFNARFVHYGPGLGPLEMGQMHARSNMPSIYQYNNPQPALSSSSSNVLLLPAKQQHYSDFVGAPQRHHRNILQVDDNGAMDADDLLTLNKNGPESSNPWKKETIAFFPSSSSSVPSSMTMATGEAANKTILMCPATTTALQWPGEEMSANFDEITFLLPASSAVYIPSSHLVRDSSSSSSSAFSTMGRSGGGNIVQVTCKIVDARMTSLDSLLVQ